MREVKRMRGHRPAFSIQIARLLCLGIVAMRLCASAQGTFENLDFEQAKVDFIPGGLGWIYATKALPGWTVYFNGVAQQYVSYNQVFGPAVVGIFDTNTAVSPPLLDGRFAAILGGSGLVNGAAAIGQSGLIPTSDKSLGFLALGGQFSVFFAGHSLLVRPLGNGPNFSEIYGADISAYAGEYGQLLFQAGGGGGYYLDDITFSTQPVPEPAVLSILGLGLVMLFLRFSGRGVCSPTKR